MRRWAPRGNGGRRVADRRSRPFSALFFGASGSGVSPDAAEDIGGICVESLLARLSKKVRGCGRRTRVLAATVLFAASGAACGEGSRAQPEFSAAGQALAHRAYVVSLESDELTVIDLDRLEIIGRVPTGGISNHMAELNADFTKVYIDSAQSDEAVVVDAVALEVRDRISVGRHPTHLSLSRDGRLMAVMDEDEDAVSFIDTERDVEVKRLGGFKTPHFFRWAPDGRSAYVANLGAYHLSRVNTATLEIDGAVALEGYAAGVTEAPREGGFADAQIDVEGVMYAAHSATGRVLVYDTKRETKLPELNVGKSPWIVFADHPFKGLPRRYLGPNFGDATVSMIDGGARRVTATLPGDAEAYGVNYSPLAPNKAFVMNRVRRDVAVVDTLTQAVTKRIPVGGNTETAATTADGKYIVAAVSNANRVVVIDVETETIVKVFEDVGKYPWSVTIPLGQNYCH